MMGFATPLRWCLVVPLAAMGACTDRLPSAPAPEPAALPATQKVECRADLAAATVRCGEMELGGHDGLILGGQNTLVRLTSSDIVYAGGSLTFSVRVQNLVGQALGTVDGTSPAPGGVRVFLTDAPAVTSGSGSVTVVPDGVAPFTGADQAYFQYSEMLAPNATSAPRTWRFDLPATVNTFTFGVYVSAPVRYPDGWVAFASAPGTLPVGGTVALAPSVMDRLGRPLAGQSVSYASSNPSVAAVDPATGVISASALGTATITATSGARTGSVAVTVGAPVSHAFYSPANGSTLVGTTLQTTMTLYDANFNLLSGRRIVYSSSDPSKATVNATGLVTALAPGQAVITATVEGRSPTATITVTSPAAGIVQMTQVAVGANHTCGLASGAAYCWGPNASGQLGAGLATSEFRNVPTAVSGGLSFVSLSSGHYRSCALTGAGAAWCWGNNATGALGDGTLTESAVPVAVAGGLTFSALVTSRNHTCGIATPGGQAYCWGDNEYGQLGDGTNTDASVPAAVAGGHAFASISAAWDHTCAVDANGAAWCWGNNPWGGLGDGTRVARNTPVAVAGGLTFTSVSAGMSYTCGVTPAQAAWCWGDNSFAQLGNGLETSVHSSNVPVSVSGGHSFAAVSAASRVGTCAVTTAGAAFCWGRNDGGVTLGTGPVIGSSNVPARVGGGLVFTSLSAGAGATCGITGGFAYCWGAGQTGALGQGAYADRAFVTPVARGDIP